VERSAWASKPLTTARSLRPKLTQEGKRVLRLLRRVELLGRLAHLNRASAFEALRVNEVELDNFPPGEGPTSRMTDGEMGAQGR
jgi:hypothetical protein